MTKDEVLAVVLEAQAMSENDQQRARDMIDKLSERFPVFKSHERVAYAAAIYGLALSKVPLAVPRKRNKKVKGSSSLSDGSQSQ